MESASGSQIPGSGSSPPALSEKERPPGRSSCLPSPDRPPQDSWSARPDSAPRTPPTRRRILNQCRDSFCFPYFFLRSSIRILFSDIRIQYTGFLRRLCCFSFRMFFKEHMFLFRIAQPTEKYKKQKMNQHLKQIQRQKKRMKDQKQK